MLSYIRKVAQVRKDDGASAVEYGLLVAAIAALIVIIVFALGGLVKGIFKDTCDTLKSNATGSSASAANCNT
jgi:pilus assembly protein Flp/PilA